MARRCLHCSDELSDADPTISIATGEAFCGANPDSDRHVPEVFRLSRTELKHHAQEVLMHGIGNQLGYYNPDDDKRPIPTDQRDEFQQIMRREADRVARLLGYEKAWTN